MKKRITSRPGILMNLLGSGIHAISGQHYPEINNRAGMAGNNSYGIIHTAHDLGIHFSEISEIKKN